MSWSLSGIHFKFGLATQRSADGFTYFPHAQDIGSCDVDRMAFLQCQRTYHRTRGIRDMDGIDPNSLFTLQLNRLSVADPRNQAWDQHRLTLPRPIHKEKPQNCNRKKL
jgi:hypothetical protein